MSSPANSDNDDDGFSSTLRSSKSSTLGDSHAPSVRGSKRSRPRHQQIFDSDDDGKSTSEDSEPVIPWSPSLLNAIQKRKALEEELRKLNDLEVEVAAKKTKLVSLLWDGRWGIAPNV
jgi:hypothetical protein